MQTLASVEAKAKAIDRLPKVQNPDLYYSNLHIECYYFHRQYKDHFETTGAKGYKRVSFMVFFSKDKILFY